MRWCDREAAAATGGHVAKGAVRGSLKRQQGGERESRVEASASGWGRVTATGFSLLPGASKIGSKYIKNWSSKCTTVRHERRKQGRQAL